MKVFTIELWQQYWERTDRIFEVGTRVQTNREYTAGDDESGPLKGVILGRIQDTKYDVNPELKSQGYECHEVYSIRFDGDEKPTVVWPEEIDLEIQVNTEDKNKTIMILLDDFIKQHPETNRETRVAMHTMLASLSIDGLKLLARDLIK